MKSYDRILRAVYAQPWAIQPEKLEAIIGFLELKSFGVDPAVEIVADVTAAGQMMAARAKLTATSGGGAVAVLPLYGIIGHRANVTQGISGPGGTSTEMFTAQFRMALKDPKVTAIVIDVDSPGGAVGGVPELADEIYSARGQKPIIAVANTLMASAAYWIACAASEIVASPSAMIGSIGVFSAHEDQSKALNSSGVKVTLISAGKYKTEGNQYEPLSEEALGAKQAMVNEFYGSFVRAVAHGRNVKAEDVRNGYGQGRVLSAKQSVQAGLADRVGTLDDVLAKYGVGTGSNRQAMRAEAEIDVAAETVSLEISAVDTVADPSLEAHGYEAQVALFRLRMALAQQ